MKDITALLRLSKAVLFVQHRSVFILLCTTVHHFSHPENKHKTKLFSDNP